MKKRGLVILRAYYGYKVHIKKYVDLEIMSNPQLRSGRGGMLYWEDDEELPDGFNNDAGLANLYAVNVTTAVRFQLDRKLGEHKQGGLHLKCNDSSMAFMLGFYNPIPECQRETIQPSLCLLYKLMTRNEAGEETWQMHHEYFDDHRDVKIMCPVASE